jgi:hypothetical protein
MSPEQHSELQRELSQIADVLWHHERNLMASWEYDEPRPRRGKNYEQRLAQWEADKNAARQERIRELRADGRDRLQRVRAILASEIVVENEHVDIPWPSPEETADINARNVAEATAEAKAARTKRYPILRWTDNIRYVDWHSRTHDELLAHALKMGLAGVGESVELGWVDRDEETGETTYTWIESPRSV